MIASPGNTVADVIAQTLSRYGARFAFGIPGNDVLESVRACEEAGIEFVLAKAEPSAAFMADAVYQLTGAPAVLIPALGPGIANAVSGIAGAWMERSGVAVLCGEMGTRNMAVYNHQVFDHVALCRPVTKYAERLNPLRAGQQMAKALDIALEWPAGPVLLNIPSDANKAPAADSAPRPPVRLATCLAPAVASSLRAALAAARRPLALVGRGALHRDAAGAAAEFIRAWRLPFFATYKAKGVTDEHDPLCLGSVGLSPVVDAINLRAVAEADLLVLIGFDPIELRDAWVDAWPADKACITLDWAPANDRIFPRGQEAYGTLDAMLRQLAPAGGDRGDGTSALPGGIAATGAAGAPAAGVAAGAPALAAAAGAAPPAGWPAALLDAIRRDVAHVVRPRIPAGAISPAALFHAVDRRIRPDWIMTVDVGAHRILANHVLRCRVPGQLLQSNGLGCMGYAVPAAIAAQLVHPARTVVALLGDGCLLMTLGELAVAAERKLPLIVVVLNDAKLSLIALKQDKMDMAPRGVDFASPDFARIAQGFGADGVRVDSLAAFEGAFDAALAARRLTVIEAMVDPAEYWEQM
ncbi:MAG: thiamine pyrophosphate-binding protein [Burkholderiales bacterium]|nr:thiamine pyrophosphate-binding protein [Burkholderiales bacterium]